MDSISPRNYLKKRAQEEIPPITFPYQKNRPLIDSFNYEEREITVKVNNNISPACILDQQLFTIALTSLCIFLKKYNDNNDITVGTFALVEKDIKLIPVCCNFSSVETIGKSHELINQVLCDIEKQVNTNKYGGNDVVDISSLFRVLLVPLGIKNSLLKGKTLSSDDLDNYTYDVNTRDLILYVSKEKNDVVIKIQYNTDLYYEDYIANLLDTFGLLVQTILNRCIYSGNSIAPTDCSELLLNDVSLLTNDRLQQIVYDWNKTEADYSKDKTIHQLFEEQVERTPNNIAVVFEDTQLTYRELNERSNQLARYIREQYEKQTQQDFKPDTLIALSLDRSLEMIISILGVLKAGGAYVPIDPAYPDERINYMLEDANVPVLIIQDKLREKFSNYKGKFLKLDSQWDEIAKQPKLNLISDITSRNLAYVIYTSGSTGKPKGVMIEHYSLLNIYFGWDKFYQLSKEKHNHLQMASFSFDVFCGDFLRALCSGGKLVMSPQEYLLEPNLLYSLIIEEKITCAEFVPVVLKNLVDYLEYKNLKLRLKILICGSDYWLLKDYQRFQKVCVSCTRLINSYGLTEATIDSIFFEKAFLNIKSIDHMRAVPIGRPITNTQTYILNRFLRLLPIGVSGELYIGGEGLARGYLNRPKLTRERFIENPFLSEEEREEKKKRGEETRLYQTGDLARYLSDGNIEFLGRIDDQVKIRGFRIELTEIESAISKIEGIKQVTVQAREKQTESGTNKYLVAYYIKEPLVQITSEVIISYLSQRLPDYMIPSAFVELESFPLTVNGKLDRKALPDPKFTDKESYVAPRNELEEQLCSIWQEVLGIEKVGISDDFFRIGGDSILSILLSSKMRKAGLHCSVKDIFEYRTIHNFFRYFKKNEMININKTIKLDKFEEIEEIDI